jgi:hypothetical protein
MQEKWDVFPAPLWQCLRGKINGHVLVEGVPVRTVQETLAHI